METVETKICKQCGFEKPLSEFYIRKDNNKPRPKCIKCFNAEQDQRKLAKLSVDKQAQIAQYRKQQNYLLQGLKECGRCKDVKAVEEYMTKTGTISYAYCTICRPLFEKEYFKNNPDKHSDRHKTRVANREFIITYIQSLKEAGCADCGKYYPDAMEFDHTCAQQDKFMDISRLHYVGKDEDMQKMLKTELSKGEYVCVNCHRQRTYKRSNNVRIIFLSNPNSHILNSLHKFVYSSLSRRCCIDCQEDNFLVLEFDHIRGSKVANISTMIKRPTTFSLDMVKEEIEKCEVRCGNCHRLRTRARQLGKEITAQAPKNNTGKVCQCGNKKTLEALTCLKCCNQETASKSQDRYGDLDTLLLRLKISNFTQIGKELGVSGNAVKKYIMRRGIDPKTLLPMMSDEGNENN